MDNLPKELVKGSEASSILSGKTEQGRSRILHVEWKALWGKQKWEENHWEHFSRSRGFWEQTSPKWVLAARQAGDPFFPEVGSRVEAQSGGSDLLWEY